jgi:hypothetical protein
MVVSLLDLTTTSVDAFLYGFFGAIGGAIIAWLGAKHLLSKPWNDLLGLLHRHVAAQETIAARLPPKDDQS